MAADCLKLDIFILLSDALPELLAGDKWQRHGLVEECCVFFANSEKPNTEKNTRDYVDGIVHLCYKEHVGHVEQ